LETGSLRSGSESPPPQTVHQKGTAEETRVIPLDLILYGVFVTLRVKTIP
jgi:hypothetical protein